MDPLTVAPRSVRVTDDRGRSLPHEVATSAGAVTVTLRVDAGLLAAPPSGLRVRLAGLPAVHAVATVDGRRLARAAAVEVALRAELVGGRSRLVAVGGRPLAALPDEPLRLDGPLVLEFDGPLDPATLDASAGPLFRSGGGLALAPAPAATTWTCRAARFELRLAPPPGAGRLLLDLGRAPFRDLTGARPGPPLVLEVLAP